MNRVRIGAVGYLNARPLTWALDRYPDRWQMRYDVPSVCARLLHEGAVDLGLIPSIEYLRSPDYRFVPGVGIGARGPVASVALYSRLPLAEIRSIALDTSSRTSVTLIRVLCRYHFKIEPEFVPHGPDLAAMTDAHGAGLLIGDPAFDVDHEAMGLSKFDLGEEWLRMTGLPFVFAAWMARPGVALRDLPARLEAAKREGLTHVDEIVRRHAVPRGWPPAQARRYLTEYLKFDIGPRQVEAMRLFHRLAAEHGVIETVPAEVELYDG